MRAGWVCLLFHDVASGPVESSGGPAHFSVSIATFERQLDLLRAEELPGRSVGTALAGGAPCVAVSFDDGTAGMYERAFPALAERGMSATFYVTTSWVGTPGYVTWPQLREMRAAGMEIQSHTRTHPFLSELGPERLRDELRGSKAELDEHLGQDTDQIALPGGDAPRRALWHEIGAAGYRIVGTSRWGSNSLPQGEPLRIKRCTVRGEPSDEWFRRVARGDRRIALRRHARESLLAAIRTRMGPSRYARWRRRFLDARGHGDAETLRSQLGGGEVR